MSEMLQSVQMTGPDNRMDQTAEYGPAVNVLPEKCTTCGFPDIDLVPDPYLLKRLMGAPAEMVLAEMGNFLVRERARRILEIVCPLQCQFYPTMHFKTREPTNWFLAVPKRLILTGRLKASIRRCPSCLEPETAHGTEYEWRGSPAMPWDVAKSLNWLTSSTSTDAWSFYKERGKIHGWRPRRHLNRQLLFSVRLWKLMERLRMRSLVAYIRDHDKTPTGDDLRWIDAALAKIKAAGLAKREENASGRSKANLWLARFVKNYATAAPFDSQLLEQQFGVKLPKTFKDFAVRIGEFTFAAADDAEECDIRIGPASKQNVDIHYDVTAKEQEAHCEKPFPFGWTPFGDEYVFDLAEGEGDSPVYRFDHETMIYEPYAANFAECVKRWVEK